MGAIAKGIAAYAQPLIDQTDGSLEQLNKALALTTICYNLALVPDDRREKAISDLRPGLEMDDEEFAEFRRSIIEPMVRRHKEMFPLLHRRVSAHPLQSGPSSRAPSNRTVSAESNRAIDRYAPCPCNSGEKYKFCCGAKGR